MDENIYGHLTREFNVGQLRCIVSSGQAVVIHQLAMMSKDGDWIARETPQALNHVLQVLAAHGARYRLGAPLDVAWMAGGWSAHFEFRQAHSSFNSPTRVRTDFVTRPPRLSPDELVQMWREQEAQSTQADTIPVIDLARLARLKQTDRERDYAVIGELARRMSSARDQLLYGRSARDLIELAAQYPNLSHELQSQRPLLAHLNQGRDAIETALDAERRQLMRRNEARLDAYMKAARNWYAAWPGLSRQLDALPLLEAHEIMVQKARELLPIEVSNPNEEKF